MMPFETNPDLAFGTIFEVSGSEIRIELDKTMAELSRSHRGRIYPIGQVASLIKIPIGRKVLLASVKTLRMANEADSDESVPMSPDTRVLVADLFGEGTWSPTTSKFRFSRGVSRYPLPRQSVYLVTRDEAQHIYGSAEGQRTDGVENTVKIGEYVAADGTPCRANIDKLFSHHCAILGSTGSGKSAALAAVIHSILDKKSADKPTKPRIVIIDPHGEYAAAFGSSAKVYRAYGGDGDGPELNSQLALPYWLMSGEEFRQLVIAKTEQEATSQNNVALKALSHARLVEANMIEASIKPWGNPATGNHPQIPRPLSGISEDAIGSFNRDRPLPFKLSEFRAHIEKEQNCREVSKIWKELTATDYEKLFSSLLEKLRVLATDARLDFLMKEHGPESPTLEEILSQFVGEDSESPEAYIRIIDISGLPNEIAGPLTAMIGRLLFQYKLHQNRTEREQDPVVLVCEEAHRYVPDRGEAEYAAAQTSIRRIAREGRKYGLGLVLVSQRPSDIESTVISQCSSWIVLRLSNAADQQHVARYLPDSLAGMTRLLSALPRQEAIFVGEAAAIPAQIRLNTLPEGKRPSSQDVSFSAGWLNDFHTAESIAPIANRMQSFKK